MAGLLTWIRTLWPKPVEQYKTSELKRKTILFYRDFRGFTGGHLKVWHYFNHVCYSRAYQPQIVFSTDTLWDSSNPWLPIRQQTLTAWDAQKADILFLAGMDWVMLSEAERRNPPRPIFNLVQHVRHADPNQPLYHYLSHRAIRICVSEAVAEALMATGRVNGPLFTIPNGIDESILRSQPLQSWAEREVHLLIVGIKQPLLARQIYNAIVAHHTQLHVEVLVEPVPRSEFLRRLGNAQITLFLPHATEGFYLPALEGFALGTLVICPDCVGNRAFCLAGQNCLQPAYTVEALYRAVQKALDLSDEQRQLLLRAAQQTAQYYSLSRERQAFLTLLEQVETIW